MRVIAIANQKGGCGKTTTSINLSACLSFLQKKVLLVDLDPQGHSTCGLGVRLEKDTLTVYDLLSPTQYFSPAISNVAVALNSGFDILPSNGRLNALEEEFSFMPDQHKRFGELIERIKKEQGQYDFIVLDCPPNLGVLTWNALYGADEVIIPVEPSFFSLHGLGKITETIQIVNESRANPLNVHALLTLFNSDFSFSQEILYEVKTHFKESLFNSIIHESIQLKEAASAGESIARYAPNSTAFRDYLNLAVEYLEREWDRQLPENRLGWDKVLDDHFGPRQVSGGVLFQFQNKTAKTVEIAGDFNHWIPEPLISRNEKGLWQKIIHVDQKTFRYKFIIDGEWQIDPNQPSHKENSYGGVDSYLELS